MKKFKVGIIGCGMAFERLHYPAYMQLTEQYEIKALCDIDRKKAQNWAARLNLTDADVYADYREMINTADLDIADIMVPIELNFEITEAVARTWSRQNKGIISEKPLAPTFGQALHARVLAKKYGLPIMIAENYRYNQENDLIRDLVRTNKVGSINYFIFNRTANFPKDMYADTFAATEWRQHPEYPGGVITDAAVHDLAGLQHIFGAIRKVHAFGRPMQEDFSPYSTINVNLEFENGVIGQFAFCCTVEEIQRPLVGLRIFGESGMIYLEEKMSGVVNIAYNDGRSERLAYETEKGFYNELLNFSRSLDGQEQISVTPEIEFGDLRVITCILESIKENKVITIDGDIPLHFLDAGETASPDALLTRGNH